MKIQNAYKNRLLMGFIGVLSLVAIGCEKDGSGMTEVDLSSDLMGGALDAEMGNLIPDYETIDKRLRTARMTGKANPKDVERVRGRINEYRVLEARLKTAVDAGQMTKDEASVALARAKKEMFGAGKGDKGRKGPPPPMDLDKMEQRITDAIAAGKLTGAKAEEMLAAMAKARETEAAIKVAVDAGDLTVEEGARKLQAALREIFPRPEGGKGRKGPPPPMDLDKMEQRITDAIAAGKLTGAKAEEMLAAMAKARETEAAIKVAVDAGDLTVEEGARKLQAALREIFPRPEGGKGRKGPPPPKGG